MPLDLYPFVYYPEYCFGLFYTFYSPFITKLYFVNIHTLFWDRRIVFTGVVVTKVSYKISEFFQCCMIWTLQWISMDWDVNLHFSRFMNDFRVWLSSLMHGDFYHILRRIFNAFACPSYSFVLLKEIKCSLMSSFWGKLLLDSAMDILSIEFSSFYLLVLDWRTPSITSCSILESWLC